MIKMEIYDGEKMVDELNVTNIIGRPALFERTLMNQLEKGNAVTLRPYITRKCMFSSCQKILGYKPGACNEITSTYCENCRDKVLKDLEKSIDEGLAKN